ncbi:hypothetical protein, partial [Novipirellula sp.]|uniref:hypothetical protein n=1 Tax=Novipirellula sp. TaxID=2795430 RepID=UPI0035620A08
MHLECQLLDRYHDGVRIHLTLRVAAMMLSGLRWRSIFATGIVFIAASVADAQSIVPNDVIHGMHAHVTREGGEVASWQIDPFMTEQQEADILAFLQEPCRFAWDDGLTLPQLTRDMSTRVATEIDVHALQEIGLKESLVLIAKRHEQPSFAITDHDPFAGPSRSESQRRDQTADSQVNVPGGAANRTGVVPWWRSSEVTRGLDYSRADIQTPSVGAKVAHLLAQSDLVLSIRSGQLTITTREGAEEQLAIRVYDVTPLVGRQREPETKWNASGAASWQPSYSRRG